jgi:arylsulfatase A-like enzyme
MLRQAENLSAHLRLLKQQIARCRVARDRGIADKRGASGDRPLHRRDASYSAFHQGKRWHILKQEVWDSLNDDQKKVYARMMEVYAATVAESDYEIGRVVEALQQAGQLDNTLIIYLEGDNGASAEGTMQGTTNEVSAQFAPEFSNSSFQWWTSLVATEPTTTIQSVGPMRWTRPFNGY